MTLNYGASDFYRLAACPGCHLLEKDLPGIVTAGASEGTRLHELCENTFKLGGAVDVPEEIQDVAIMLKDLFELENSTRGKCGVSLELHVDLSYLGLSPERGRIDRVTVFYDAKLAVIVDYKFGEQWIAPPEKNWQAKVYCDAFFQYFAVEKIHFIFALPKQEKVLEHTFTLEELKQNHAELVSVMEKAESATLADLHYGEHCQWCKAKLTCPARMEGTCLIPAQTNLPEFIQSLSPESRGNIFSKVQEARKWLNQVEGTFKQLYLESGVKIAGYEIGEGRKSREWIDEKFASDAIVDMGLRGEIDVNTRFFHPLVSVAQAEKILGKQKKILAGLWQEVPGDPCIKEVKNER